MLEISWLSEGDKRSNKKYIRPVIEWFSVDFYTYVLNYLMLRVTKNCRGEKGRGGKKIDDFRSKLGFKLLDIIMSKEKSVTTKIIKAFRNKKTLQQHSILTYQIDLCFPEHKLVI